jgi:alpha-glucosidase (family GH31 glycosyl hydrolase)
MYQLGTFFPFYRAHCSIDNVVREPWLQTVRVQEVIRNSVFLRYSLIHYLQTAFDEASTQGTPIMRPMFLEFPSDTSVFDKASQFMFGEHILVSAKVNQIK